MINTICGTISNVDNNGVQVKVERKSACQGCQAANICHSFSKSTMNFMLSRPTEPVEVGDTVLVAIESSSFLKACAYSFMIPLLFVVAILAITMWLDLYVSIQALSAAIAFAISLIVVRQLGKTIQSPRIVEVIHEE